VPVHLAGKVLLRGTGMQPQVMEHCEVGLNYLNTNAKLHGLLGDAQMVLFAFDPKGLARLRHLMAVVVVLDGLFEPNCDEQANCDGRNMDEKILPCAHRVVGGMDVEHRYCVFLIGCRCGSWAGIGFGRRRRGVRSAGVVGEWALSCRAGTAVFSQFILPANRDPVTVANAAEHNKSGRSAADGTAALV
jgi:hypothetical protein